MPTRHLIGCVVAVVGLASILTLLAPSAGGFVVLGAFLLCPLVMVIAMKLIVGTPGTSVQQSEPTVDHTTNLADRTGR
ncbi:MAG TPA: hypothetical protein VLN74_01990 [Ilumatobacteraceae bacterium]|nr:hypothetical protein [Ilumatobacteraceae bacterium]